MSIPAIRVDRVGKEFRFFASAFDRVKEALHPAGRRYHTPIAVLRDVSFTVPHGQTVAILGPNFAGKSTLLHLVAGLVEPTSGTIATDGRVFGLLDLAGWFAPELTGRQNVRFFHDVILDGSGDWEARARTVAAFADIGDYFDRPVRTYSSGMFLRLAFATAISAEPDILLVDEVIAVGDARFQQKCYRRIGELRDRGATILIVTHAAESVVGLCDRVLLFDRGALVFDGEPAEGVDRYYQLFFMAPERPALEPSRAGELRFGSGGARIVHSFASRDGVHAAAAFERGDRIRVVMDVEFERDVPSPQFGFSCSSKEGVRLYATTTALLKTATGPGVAGERRRVEIAFDLTVAVGDLFVDLSVFEHAHGSVTVLDARVGALHLGIMSAFSCYGLVELSAVFSESAPRGVRAAGSGAGG